MGRKPPKVKSVVRLLPPTLETLSEPAVVSASPTAMLATIRSELTPLTASVSRVKLRVERVERGADRGDVSKVLKQRVPVHDPRPTPALQCTHPEIPGLLPLAGPRTEPRTPPHPMVSQRDP